MKQSGIYMIQNVVDWKMYIGSAKYIARRWAVHRHNLRNNKSNNVHLQRAWNKYGEDCFRFSVLVYCKPDELIELEQYFIDGLNPAYNIQQVAGSSLGRKFSEETKEKLRKASTGHVHTAEHKAKIGAAQLGKKRSPETIAKLTAANRRTRSAETREKIAIAKLGNQWNKGKHHSPETIEKMRQARRLYWQRKREEDGTGN
jgi:group I intron endonuclease